MRGDYTWSNKVLRKKWAYLQEKYCSSYCYLTYLTAREPVQLKVFKRNPLSRLLDALHCNQKLAFKSLLRLTINKRNQFSNLAFTNNR